MRSSLRLIALAVIMALCFAGVAMADGPVVPAPNSGEIQLPGDMAALQKALAVSSPVKYRILTVDDSGGLPLTDYLDQVAASLNEPQPDTLLLVIYRESNYDIRFYMGANFRGYRISVDDMLSLVRTKYLVRSQQGDPAGGLADLIAAVNASAGTPEGMQFPVFDPTIDLATRLAITQFANDWLTGFIKPGADPALAAKSVGLDSLEKVDQSYKIVFSVLPANANSAWLAGSGTPGPDGWVHGKVKLVRMDGDKVVFVGP